MRLDESAPSSAVTGVNRKVGRPGLVGWVERSEIHQTPLVGFAALNPPYGLIQNQSIELND